MTTSKQKSLEKRQLDMSLNHHTGRISGDARISLEEV